MGQDAGVLCPTSAPPSMWGIDYQYTAEHEPTYSDQESVLAICKPVINYLAKCLSSFVGVMFLTFCQYSTLSEPP